MTKIPKVVLRPKTIYLGEYSINNTDYKITIYGNGDKAVLSNALTKIIVRKSEELEKKDFTNYIYCDENYSNYLVISFYEESKFEPSMIIQVDKIGHNDWISTKENWLRYLGILQPKPDIEFELKLYSQNNEVAENNVFTIASDPIMPDIRTSVQCDGDSLELRIKIEHNVWKTWNNSSALVRDDETYYPATGWQNVKKDTVWDIDFGATVRGGKGYLIFKRKEIIVDTLVFYIRGSNPTEQEVQTYVNTLQNADGWYVPKMIRQESSFRQFNNGTPSVTNNSAGMPNWGPPYGWGMKQLDNIGSTYGYLTSFNNRYGPSPDELWNWKANVRKGIEFFNGAKLSVANTRWNNALNQISVWEATNTELAQDSYPMIIVDSPNESEENTTVTEIVAGNNAINETFVACDTPEDGQRTLRDAFACKYYNGGADYFAIVIPVASGNTGEDPPELPHWNIDKAGSTGRDYVDDISGRAGW